MPPAIVRPSRDSPPRSRGAALHAAHMKTATAAAAEILAYVWVGSQARVEVDARQPEARERALENCPEQLIHHEPGLVEGGALSLSPGTSAPARRWSGLPATFDATTAT